MEVTLGQGWGSDLEGSGEGVSPNAAQTPPLAVDSVCEASLDYTFMTCVHFCIFDLNTK